MAGRLALGTAVDGADDVRGSQDPAVGDRVIDLGHLDRRDELALADRQVAHRRSRVFVQRQGHARFLAGQFHAGGRAEAEAMHPFVEAFRAIERADLDRADVARAREDLRGGERFFGMFGVVVDRPVGDLDLIGDIEGRARRDQPPLQRVGDRNDLEGRARFVVEGDRAVLHRVRGGGTRIVGVDLRPIGQREDRPAARVHHDRGGIFGLEHAPDRRQHVFAALLDVGVEREGQRGPGHLGMRFADRHRLAERVADHAPLPGATAQQRVARVLETRQPLSFGAHQTERLRSQRPAWIHAAHHRRARDARDLQVQDRLRLRGRQRARQVHEAAAF